MVYPMNKKRKSEDQDDGAVMPLTSENSEQDRGLSNSSASSCALMCGCAGFFFVLGIVLLSVSLKRLTSVEYGLEYDRFAKHLDELAKSGGLHAGPPGFTFIKFPSTFITADLADTCVSQDGLRVQFKVTFQYQITAEMLRPAILKYRDYAGWARIVESAGTSAVQHTCADFIVSEFQTKRGVIQSKIEDKLREKLEGTPDSPEGVHALAVSLQLRELTLPRNYKNAVEAKQSAEEDIELAKNQRQQEVTKAGTTLLSAREESIKIIDTANNDANVTITQAELKAEETRFAFSKEAQVLADVKRTLNLTTDGLLAYINNQLFAVAPNLKVRAQEPARISKYDEL